MRHIRIDDDAVVCKLRGGQHVDSRDRDLSGLTVPPVGRVIATGERYEPYRMLGPDGVGVEPVTAFFRDLLAAGRAEATVRSYGMDLLRWFRFLWAITVAWDRATRIEARDFSRWLRAAGEAVTYAASVRAHSETVLRSFYDFHLQVGTGPLINPFPLDRSRGGGRAHAHHNPMEPYRHERGGLYRPRVPSRVPRSIPDEDFDGYLHSAAVESGPGSGGVLRVHKGAGLGTAVRDGGRGLTRVGS